MKYFIVIVFVHVLLQVSACPDPVTTVHIQNHDGPIYVSPNDRSSCDNQVTFGNQGASSLPGIWNYNQENQCGCQNPTDSLHHINPYHVYETECKCVTKLGTSVPINTIPQNTCTPNTYYSYPDYSYPDYSNCYNPEGQYGGGYPIASGGCPIATEGLIPLLKSYLGQGKCPKQGCQCSQSYYC